MLKRIKFMVMVLSVFVLAACGQSNDSQTNEDKVTIRLLTRMSGTSPQVDVYNEIIDEFKADYPDVEIVDESQAEEGAFNNKLKVGLASGDLAHIYRVQGVASLGEYIDNGLVMNMEPILEEDSEWAEDFTEGALEFYRVPGYEGIYAIPMESGLVSFFYNEEVFAEAGIKKFPETWDELKEAIVALKDNEVIPISLGAKTPSMGGHLHNQIAYKWLGTDVTKRLGNRELNWTDDEMIETLTFIEELVGLGAFGADAAGIDQDVALSAFLQGDAGMIITGPWNISVFSDPNEGPYYEKIRQAKFPYFAEKPQFKDEDMQVISPYMVNDSLEGKEREYAIELVKRLTNSEASKRFAEDALFISGKPNVPIDETKVNPLFLENVTLSATSKGIAVGLTDYDPIASMQDKARDVVISIFTGEKPEVAAKIAQEEVDKNEGN